MIPYTEPDILDKGQGFLTFQGTVTGDIYLTTFYSQPPSVRSLNAGERIKICTSFTNASYTWYGQEVPRMILFQV
jgi:hypothetical protein